VPHHRARHTPLGRSLVVRRVVEDGWTFAQAAAGAGVSKSTVWEWVRRWRAATPAEQESLACLTERSSRPRRSPTQVPAQEARLICELRERTGWSPRRLADEPEVRRAHSTVHQVLRRGGCSRRPAPARPAIVRYEWPCPGNLLHMDVKRFGKFTEPGHAITGDRTRRSRRVGWEYCHSIVDDCSRLAYSELHDDERAETVTAFTQRALDWLLGHGVVTERLMTDNAFSYTKNRSLRQLLRARQVQHLRTRPYTPRTNGKVERYQQTLQREWAYALEYASSEARRESLPHWVTHYNESRTHSALGNRPPLARVREVTGFDNPPNRGHRPPSLRRYAGRRGRRREATTMRRRVVDAIGQLP
jgi:transposase InsO family protein